MSRQQGTGAAIKAWLADAQRFGRKIAALNDLFDEGAGGFTAAELDEIHEGVRRVRRLLMFSSVTVESRESMEDGDERDHVLGITEKDYPEGIDALAELLGSDRA